MGFTQIAINTLLCTSTIFIYVCVCPLNNHRQLISIVYSYSQHNYSKIYIPSTDTKVSLCNLPFVDLKEIITPCILSCICPENVTTSAANEMKKIYLSRLQQKRNSNCQPKWRQHHHLPESLLEEVSTSNHTEKQSLSLTN